MGRQIQITSDDASPLTSRTTKHAQSFSAAEAAVLVGALRAGLKTRFGIADNEPTPYWCEEGAEPPYRAGTPRDRLCALVDALAELEIEIAEGGGLSLMLKVDR